MPGSYSQFFVAMRQQESSNNYGQHSSTYLGAYQFGEQALVQLGFVNNDGVFNNDFSGGFTGKLGINSVAEFLDSIPAQEAAAEEWWPELWRQIRAADLEFYDHRPSTA